MAISTHDFLLADNIVHSHLNTGFFYLRSTPATLALFSTVLALNMLSPSRDQIRTNEVLGTVESRRIEGTEELRMEWISEGKEWEETKGIRVGVLDSSVFRHFHYEFDLPKVGRSEAVVRSFPFVVYRLRSLWWKRKENNTDSDLMK